MNPVNSDSVEERLLALECMVIYLTVQLKVHQQLLFRQAPVSPTKSAPEVDPVRAMVDYQMGEAIRTLADRDPAKATQLSRLFEAMKQSPPSASPDSTV